MHQSLFISYPRALFTAVSLPMEMLNAANTVARIQPQDFELWRSHIVSSNITPNTNQKPATIETTKGLFIQPPFYLDSAPKPNTVFLPPIWGKPDAVIKRSGDLLKHLEQWHSAGVNIVAVGTAVCFLAELGLLDNKVATTHWYYFDQFEHRYPKVRLQRHHFITQDDNLYTTGSINSLIDLVLYFINQSHGDDCAKVIEQQFNHEISRTYDKPWYSSGSARHPDENIIEVQQWMQSHYGINFTLKALSEMANMSERTFSRRFKNAVGQSPLAYGIALKMQNARELLKSTNLNNSDIADQLGFKESDYFIRLFRQKNGMTPGQYRKMVRGKLFSA